MMKTLTLFSILLVLLILIGLDPSFVSAQGSLPPPALPTPPPQTPIDGGLALLAASGSAYALKKLRARKK